MHAVNRWIILGMMLVTSWSCSNMSNRDVKILQNRVVSGDSFSELEIQKAIKMLGLNTHDALLLTQFVTGEMCAGLANCGIQTLIDQLDDPATIENILADNDPDAIDGTDDDGDDGTGDDNGDDDDDTGTEDPETEVVIDTNTDGGGGFTVNQTVILPNTDLDLVQLPVEDSFQSVNRINTSALASGASLNQQAEYKNVTFNQLTSPSSLHTINATITDDASVSGSLNQSFKFKSIEMIQKDSAGSVHAMNFVGQR